MAAQLRNTTEFNIGRTETLSHERLGWGLEAAASVMRAKHHVFGGGLIYALPLVQKHREAGIVSVAHECTYRGRGAMEVAS